MPYSDVMSDAPRRVHDTIGDAPRGSGQASSAPLLVRAGETQLVDWTEGLLTEAEKARREQSQEDQWETWLNGYWGEVWTQDLPTFKPPIVINELQSNILMEVSDLTDTPIRIFVQKDRTKGDRDEKVEKAIQAYWKRNFIDQEVMKATLDAMIYPCGFLTVRFDPLANHGRGKILVTARSPSTVYPDPDATSDDDWRFVILKDVLDLVYIQQAWPDQGPRVRPDAAHSVKLSDQQASQRGPMGLSGRYAGPLYAGGAGGMAQGFAKARAAVLSVFILDDAVEDEVIERTIEKINDETGEKVLTRELVGIKRKKYPNGRLIQVSNGVVLSEAQIRTRGRFPVIRVNLQPSIHQFWPPASILAGVLESYRAANKMDSMVVENGIRLNGGILIASTRSGIDPAKFANIPGQVLLVPPGEVDQVKILYPPPMPADMVTGGERLRSYARNVLGMRPSRIGEGQRGNVSPELTETEIMQAMGLTRLRGRLLHNAVQKLVEVMFAHMALYYQTPFIIPHIQGDRWEPITWDPILDPDAYAVHVDPATFQVKARTALQRLYFTLAKMGKMPNDELLNALEIPDAEEVAKKLEKQLQLEAAANVKKKKG